MSEIQQKNISLSKFLMWSLVDKILLFGHKWSLPTCLWVLKWLLGRWDDNLSKKLTLPNIDHWKNALAKCTYHFLSLTDCWVVVAGAEFLVYTLKINFPKRKSRFLEWFRKFHGTEVWSFNGKMVIFTLWSPNVTLKLEIIC